MKITGLFICILLLFIIYWAYEESNGLRDVLDGAVKTQGVVVKIVEIEAINKRTKQNVVIAHKVYVKFKTPGGTELVKPLQHNVSKPYSTVLYKDTTTRYFTVDETIPILFNSRLSNRVWVDDFFELWIYPIFLGLIALACVILIGLFIFTAFKRQKDTL